MSQDFFASDSDSPELTSPLIPPDIAESLALIMRRLDAMESTLSTLSTAIKEAPNLVATVADTADTYIRSAQDRGIDFDERLVAVAPLIERATEPETLRSLTRIVDRLTELEIGLEAAMQIPALGATTIDAIDDWVGRAYAAGFDIEQRGHDVIVLVERLTAPETMLKINTLIDMAEQAPGLIAMLADVFDTFVMKHLEAGADINKMAHSAVQGMTRIGEFMLSEEFNTLLDSGILDPEAIRLVGRLGEALSDVSHEDQGTPGIFTLLARGRSSETRRGLGFGMRLIERFGELTTKQLESN